MKILAIDTSGLTASVALIDESKTIAEFTVNYKKTHSQTIMPMIQNMFDILEMDLSSVDYLACSNGPGSFTGLRIGAATIKGLALALDKKVISVPTLDAMAYNIFECERVIIPIMDARRNQVYTCIYRWNEGSFEKISEYMALDISELISHIKEHNMKPIFLGDGVDAFKNIILESGLDFKFAPQNANMQRAASVASFAINNLSLAACGNDFNIMYLRKSQAEREYDERASKADD